MAKTKNLAVFGLIALILFSGCTIPTDGRNGGKNADFRLSYRLYGGFTPEELATEVLLIDGNGEVTFVTKNPSDEITGEKTANITPQEVDELIALLESNGFWEMEELYGIPPGGPIVIDAANLDLTVMKDGKTKSVSVEPFVDYALTPKLKEITEKISAYFELFREPQVEKTFVSIDPVQCSSNPWEQWFAESGTEFCPEGSQCKPVSENEVITRYFEKVHGITVYSVESYQKYDLVCDACSCPRGDELRLLVNITDVEKMEALGWKEVKPIVVDGSTNISIEYFVQPGFVINPVSEKLTLSNDGTATYETEELRDGNKTTKQLDFSRQKLEEIAARLVDLGFFDITKLEKELVTDVPSYTLSVTVGGNTRIFNWEILKEKPESFSYILREIEKINPPEISVSTDKQEYDADENISITLNNISDANAFFGGCNDYDLERYNPDSEWAFEGWEYVQQKECFWEGMLVKLSPGESVERQLALDEPGTYHIRVNFGTGCKDGKPFSDSECRQFDSSISDEFIVVGSASLECSTAADCDVGGCSGQVCTTAENAPSIITTCEYRDEYSCLGLAGCGCIDNRCQWGKEKPEYRQCIAGLPSGNGSNQPQ